MKERERECVLTRDRGEGGEALPGSTKACQPQAAAKCSSRLRSRL